jgi:ABC-type branched-subunit amino acid transport system ATPase component
MIKLERKRDVLAMNLTYAEQRALEIGITIAGGADVILLDEPTAGMSKSETERFVELIREVTVGKTLLTVEHDMGVVFGLADKIAVLVYGEVLAFDTPEAVRANPRVQEAYLGSVLADAGCGPGTEHAVAGVEHALHAYYGKSHVLHGVTCAWAGRDRQPAGRNGSGRSTTVKAIMGLVDAEARCAGRARNCWAKPSRSPTWASATCPRTATSSPSSRCTRTCCSAEARGKASRAGASTTCTACSRA